MTDDDEAAVVAAGRTADTARLTLFDTLQTVRERLDPKALSKRAVDGLVKQSARAAVRQGKAAMRRDPANLFAVTMLALFYIVRRPVAKAVRQRHATRSKTKRMTAQAKD